MRGKVVADNSQRAICPHPQPFSPPTLAERGFEAQIPIQPDLWPFTGNLGTNVAWSTMASRRATCDGVYFLWDIQVQFLVLVTE
jgi:hypothetical protein